MILQHTRKWVRVEGFEILVEPNITHGSTTVSLHDKDGRMVGSASKTHWSSRGEGRSTEEKRQAGKEKMKKLGHSLVGKEPTPNY